MLVDIPGIKANQKGREGLKCIICFDWILRCDHLTVFIRRVHDEIKICEDLFFPNKKKMHISR